MRRNLIHYNGPFVIRVNLPWIPEGDERGTKSKAIAKLGEGKFQADEQLKEEYTRIVKEQSEEKVVERVPVKPAGQRVFSLQHRPPVRTEDTTTKVRIAFDANSKPHPLANSIDDLCPGISAPTLGHHYKSENVSTG